MGHDTIIYPRDKVGASVSGELVTPGGSRPWLAVAPTIDRHDRFDVAAGHRLDHDITHGPASHLASASGRRR